MSAQSRLLTLAEIAELHEITERRLRRIVREKDVPVLRDGHWIRFDDIALAQLREALRAPCHSTSSAAKTQARSRSAAPSPANAYAAALRATTSPSPERRQQPSKRRSFEQNGTGNVVALDRSPKR